MTMGTIEVQNRKRTFMRATRFNILNSKSESGATLIEVTMAIGIVGIVAAGMAQFYTNSIRAQRQAKARAAMQFVAQDIENKMKSPSSIYLSLLNLPKNKNLNPCVLVRVQAVLQH